LLYGHRADPSAALTRLGERLSASMTAEAVLPAVADTVRASLRLPYAAVVLDDGAGPAAESGQPVSTCERYPLTHAGGPVGTLLAGVRRGEAALGAADARLLRAFASQAAVAVHDMLVTEQLRRSRAEERRRIRRDLHDGVGPALAGISLGLEGAARRARPLDGELGDLLETLRDETTGCVAEVRRIVGDLRPAALDGVGLVAALRQYAEAVTARAGGALKVEFDAGDLPVLPPAVEAAAYRIALEALTNVIRHSHAAHCELRVRMDGGLVLSVADDGVGLPPAAGGHGTGLASMRARAEELGGSCTVRVEGGTVVTATLPIGAP
jgi:two-component system, NarL family, sensor kinase